MKKIIASLFVSLSLVGRIASAQENRAIDSLKHQLLIAQQDTSRVLIIENLMIAYRYLRPDSALIYAEKALNLAKKINFPKGEVVILNRLAGLYRVQGDIPKSLEYRYKAWKIMEEKLPSMNQDRLLNGIGLNYMDINDYPKALDYYRKALKATQGGVYTPTVLYNIAQTFFENNQLDSAWYYLQLLTKDTELLKKNVPDLNASTFLKMGEIQFQRGNYRSAFDYWRQSKKYASGEDLRITSNIYATISEWYRTTNQPDSSIYYAQKALFDATSIDYQKGILVACDLLVGLYELNDKTKALYYHKMARVANDELYGVKKVQSLQKIIVDELERQQKAETDKIVYENQLKQYVFLAGLVALFLIASLLYLNNRQKHKANLLLNEQKEKVEHTLKTLKSTQAQLIQKEKLASLGELTAGIAHEIQNPLNFVNNFSELSVDLISELLEERNKEQGKRDEELEKGLLNDLAQNQTKINLHGKRASSIVKGMLEHSRTTTGERQLTDINQLADEYLRLSYHGLRAKDKDGSAARFNADYELITDEHLPKVEVVPQEIGRVLLNLLNNAFYAVHERAKQGETDYQPKVTVSTSTKDNQLEIRVKDNGIGMTEATKAKIFQPFFTTKPTGEGTGLGLSLAYDIVTKGHGGTIDCESIEGKGTTFIVKLSIKNS